MAERLTERHGKYINVQPKEEIMCSNYCTSCGKADCDHIRTALEKLAHYEDLEEQGRLIELPCAVGDTVWVVTRVFNGKEIVNSIGSRKIDGFIGNRFNPSFMISKEPYRLNFVPSEFGKTVFLTREEAEAALKGAEQ